MSKQGQAYVPRLAPIRSRTSVYGNRQFARCKESAGQKVIKLSPRLKMHLHLLVSYGNKRELNKIETGLCRRSTQSPLNSILVVRVVGVKSRKNYVDGVILLMHRSRVAA